MLPCFKMVGCSCWLIGCCALVRTSKFRLNASQSYLYDRFEQSPSNRVPSIPDTSFVNPIMWHDRLAEIQPFCTIQRGWLPSIFLLRAHAYSRVHTTNIHINIMYSSTCRRTVLVLVQVHWMWFHCSSHMHEKINAKHFWWCSSKSDLLLLVQVASYCTQVARKTWLCLALVFRH